MPIAPARDSAITAEVVDVFMQSDNSLQQATGSSSGQLPFVASGIVRLPVLTSRQLADNEPKATAIVPADGQIESLHLPRIRGRAVAASALSTAEICATGNILQSFASVADPEFQANQDPDAINYSPNPRPSYVPQPMATGSSSQWPMSSFNSPTSSGYMRVMAVGARLSPAILSFFTSSVDRPSVVTGSTPEATLLREELAERDRCDVSVCSVESSVIYSQNPLDSLLHNDSKIESHVVHTTTSEQLNLSGGSVKRGAPLAPMSPRRYCSR